MTEQTSTSSTLAQKGKALYRSRALRYTLATLAGLFLLFGVLGYFWLPGFAKQKAEELLSEEFDRPVRITTIEISPYALSATISGFSVGQKGADPGGNATSTELFGFDSLFVDLSTASLRGVPTVSEVRLTGPRLHLSRLADGRLNVSDLLDKWTSGPSSPTPEFSVANITVQGGSLFFDDEMQSARHEVTDLSLGIPFVANTAGAVESYVEPKFSAKINGAPFALTGTARPFAAGKDAALELNLSDFDLMRVFQYAPKDLPLVLEAARLNTRLTVNFSQPQGQDATVRLSGESSISGLAASLPKAQGRPLRLRLDKAGLRLDEATLAGAVRLSLGLQGLALSTADSKEPFAGFGSLDLAGVDVSSAGRKAKVAEVRLGKPFGIVRRLADGELDIMTALDGVGSSMASAKAEAKPAGKAAASSSDAPAQSAKSKTEAKAAPPWTWSVDSVSIAEGSLRYADDTLGPKVAPLTVEALALKLEGLTSSGSQTRLDFSARINEHGGLKLGGTVQQAPALKAELDLDMSLVDLVALQGFIDTDVNAVLTRGEISAKGRIQADGQPQAKPKPGNKPSAKADATPGVDTGGGVAASFKGDVALIDFNVLDKVNSADLLRWRSLKLTGLDAGSSPPRLGVDEIAISNFFVRALLTAQGRLNLNDVMRKEAEDEAQAAAAKADKGKPGSAKVAAAKQAAPPAPEAPKPEAPKPETPKVEATAANATAKPAPKAEPKTASGPAPDIRIGRIVLSGGNINFTDRFVKPNYTANLTDLSGRIGALKAGTLTDIAIRGKVDRTGPLDISGKADPLGPVLNLDIRAKATGIEMAGFSPYSGRYVGYVIEKGKLSVDLRYLVQNGTLEAENNVFLDQLTFGKKVDSPDAMSVPVGLLVALLQNSRGEIDINLPIKGSLDDPEFSVGGIIVKVLLNIITKAVTSPFSLLASLFSGGEDLSYVAFEPGRASLTPDAVKHLEGLAKALKDRPGLKLEIAGASDPALEAEGLKRARLERRVKAQKATELARQGKASADVGELELTQEEYARYLERVYKASSIKKPRNIVGLAKTLPVEQMEALLLEDPALGTGGMDRLAQDRGIAVQAWLVEKGGVEQARVFLLAPRVGVEPPKGVPAGGRVDFSLR
ncbi:DUF748 domain-containing protein [Humidesulfovibrio sp.]